MSRDELGLEYVTKAELPTIYKLMLEAFQQVSFVYAHSANLIAQSFVHWTALAVVTYTTTVPVLRTLSLRCKSRCSSFAIGSSQRRNRTSGAP